MFSRMALGKNVGKCVEATGVSYGELARAIGADNAQALWQLVERDSRRSQFAPGLATYFKVPLERLLADDFHVSELGSRAAANTELGPDVRGKVPLISWVQAGQWAEVIDQLKPGDAEEWIPTSVPIHKHTYALRVKGDSMRNPDGDPTFPHGSVIIVEPDSIDAPDRLVGSLVIVRRTGDDEATFKKLVRDAGKFYLMPLNPQYPRLELQEGDAFCGVVRSKEMRFF